MMAPGRRNVRWKPPTEMAADFVLTVADGQQRDLWGPAAQELLCALFLSAAVSGRSLRDVARWLDDTASPTPAELLDTAGFRALASSLRGAQNGAPETRDGIYQTARTAAACLRRGDHAVGDPAAHTTAGLQPGRLRGLARHPLPADRVPGRGVPPGRRADRHGHFALADGTPSWQAAGSTPRWS